MTTPAPFIGATPYRQRWVRPIEHTLCEARGPPKLQERLGSQTRNKLVMIDAGLWMMIRF